MQASVGFFYSSNCNKVVDLTHNLFLILNVFSILFSYMILILCHYRLNLERYWTAWYMGSTITFHPLWYLCGLLTLHLLRVSRLHYWSLIEYDIPAQNSLLVFRVPYLIAFITSFEHQKHSFLCSRIQFVFLDVVVSRIVKYSKRIIDLRSFPTKPSWGFYLLSQTMATCWWDGPHISTSQSKRILTF